METNRSAETSIDASKPKPRRFVTVGAAAAIAGMIVGASPAVAAINETPRQDKGASTPSLALRSRSIELGSGRRGLQLAFLAEQEQARRWISDLRTAEACKEATDTPSGRSGEPTKPNAGKEMLTALGAEHGTSGMAFLCGGRNGGGARAGSPSSAITVTTNLSGRFFDSICGKKSLPSSNTPLHAEGTWTEATVEFLADLVEHGWDGEDENPNPAVEPVRDLIGAGGTSDHPVAQAGRTVAAGPAIAYVVVMVFMTEELAHGGPWGVLLSSGAQGGRRSGHSPTAEDRFGGGTSGWDKVCTSRTSISSSPWLKIGSDPNAAVRDDTDVTNCDDPVVNPTPAGKTSTVAGEGRRPTKVPIQIRTKDCGPSRGTPSKNLRDHATTSQVVPTGERREPDMDINRRNQRNGVPAVIAPVPEQPQSVVNPG